ncbi:MAG: PrgI family protein [Pseudonocardiaceae bacterium]
MSTPVRIPADVERPDRVIGSLTARQVAILTVTGLVLYAAWTATRTVVPLPVFLIPAIPLAASAAILALGQRDGISLDRLALAAIRHRLAPRHQIAAPDGAHPAPDWLTARTTGDPLPGTRGARPAALHLPATGVHTTGSDGVGVVDLGPDGLALVAVASTVNFALRTPAEQEALVASFGRYLHSLTDPVQLLVRTERLNLSAQISELRAQAGALAHPALETAALEHADYLAQLAAQTDLLRRQVLLILREGPRHAESATRRNEGSPWGLRRHRGRDRETVAARRVVESRLVRRLADAVDLLGPAGIVVSPLDAGQATAVLAAACNPDTLLPPSPGMAAADDIITTPASEPSRPDNRGLGKDRDASAATPGDHWADDWPQDWPEGWAEGADDYDDGSDDAARQRGWPA